ncbi:hypothetical protein DAERI_130117 [Deinococcus aerius]|uniref:MYXO-CTERM domain-containing protein n=1 Tax=Deinococcus aerius TaxID=200253 RepID=A0A2I9DWC2_9DEIO|nr:hypothetical protein [Deinococcus aerius]GBF07287.1 hypothetical protein DAERI_130117 [Deinococcus aerius]
MTPNLKKILVALVLVAAPVTATAQTTDTTSTDTTTTDTTGTVQNDNVTTTSESDGVPGNEQQGSRFPWGLLGLIGLAGLAGRGRTEERTEVKLGGPTEGPRRS